ncbi:hypothetical protein [Streptomyces sp. NPDC057877]|uniref:hypothetical protein n=1 Tax=Streptomyces sp. NPDC057877 TaxID=3346269 RepID=UPI0036CA360F
MLKNFLMDWAVPFDLGVLPENAMPLLDFTVPGHPRRWQAASSVLERAGRDPAHRHLCGVVLLRAGLPHTAREALEEAVAELGAAAPGTDRHTDLVRADLATAYAHGDAWEKAIGVLADLLNNWPDPDLTDRHGERLATRLRELVRHTHLKLWEIDFQRLRAEMFQESAAAGEITRSQRLSWARTLIAEAEESPAIEPYDRAAQVLTSLIEEDTTDVVALEMLVRLHAAAGSDSPGLVELTRRRLHAVAPHSAALRVSAPRSRMERGLHWVESSKESLALLDSVRYSEGEGQVAWLKLRLLARARTDVPDYAFCAALSALDQGWLEDAHRLLTPVQDTLQDVHRHVLADAFARAGQGSS